MVIGMREKLAQAIHEKYRKNQEVIKPPDDPAMQPWENLREDLKESNRQQADQIPEKLRVVGYGIRPTTGGKPARLELTVEEVELLARMEHDRWLKDKMTAGWSYAPPPRNDEKKTHPCLVPWEQLPEEEKDKDCQAVRQIPVLLSEMGFEIYKME
ncbi:MAG: RyR domain-containing protein [Thermodesulfobacteriota bacterium]